MKKNAPLYLAVQFFFRMAFSPLGVSHFEWIFILFCWNRCKFCPLNDGYRYRLRSTESITAEAEYMFKKHKIRRFNLMGTDNVGKDVEDFERLLDIMIESALKNRVVYSFHSEIIPRNLNARIIEKMAIAGFVQLQIGYEAVSDNLLAKMITDFYGVVDGMSVGDDLREQQDKRMLRIPVGPISPPIPHDELRR